MLNTYGYMPHGDCKNLKQISTKLPPSNLIPQILDFWFPKIALLSFLRITYDHIAFTV